MAIKLQELSAREKFEDGVSKTFIPWLIAGIFYSNWAMWGVAQLKEMNRPNNILTDEAVEQICSDPQESKKWNQCKKLMR